MSIVNTLAQPSHWLNHLDRNSIFAHLNSRTSLLDYSSQRSKVMAALSLASFPSSWRLVHMGLLPELSERAAYWNSNCDSDNFPTFRAVRDTSFVQHRQHQTRTRAFICCHLCSWANAKHSVHQEGEAWTRPWVRSHRWMLVHLAF